MPELPEVETIKRYLQPYLTGKKFSQVEVLDPKAGRTPTVAEFGRRLLGQEIQEVGRRGKYLFCRLQGQSLIFHLRMTGILLQAETDGRARARFRFHDGSWLTFADRRRLGGIWLVEDEAAVLGQLGPEPLDEAFTPQVLAEGLRKRAVPIKALLIDQGFLAGVGNMYADEALFMAQIHPVKPGRDLSPEETGRLYLALHQVLTAGIKSQGASVDTYLLPNGQPGRAHLAFKVAHHKGKRCPRCTTPIERLPIRGRGSYFCPICQKV
ncbi:MAG: bifunctional DNA-formamidopyrimidine glycosylase/DNA-(apurinic or apyrimidinic site) lyase [Chloroflexota bacterium]